MNRNDLLRMIPYPTNADVIVYDISLKDLIDVDVFSKYNNDIAAYKIKKENYTIIKNQIEAYENKINDLYLYNKSWNETDYLEILQKDKKNYSLMFGELKNIENNINILNKKIKVINEKIDIQQKNDVKEIEKKNKDIDKEIDDINIKLIKLKEKNNDVKIEAKKIKAQIKENKEEKELLLSMQSDIKNNRCICKYCGAYVRSVNGKEKMRNLVQKNLTENEMQFAELKDKFLIFQKDINYYEKEISYLKETLYNNTQLKNQDYTLYLKKSTEVLKLEADRDEVFKQLENFKNKFKNNSDSKKQDFIELKDRIEKCELSLENLNILKESKTKFQEQYKSLNELKKDIKELYSNLIIYKKFISIYYKIYEQKINDYFGNNIKFKIFKFNDLDLIETFEATFNGIEYTQLNKTKKQEFDEIYKEKASYFLQDSEF